MRKILALLILALIPPFFLLAQTSLVISEIMPNPKGADEEREWFEIVNFSSSQITIKGGTKGWRVNDGKDHLFENATVALSPNEVLVVVQSKQKFLNEHPSFQGKIIEANFVLGNSQETLSLKDENKNLLTTAAYTSAAGGNDNGYSLVFNDGNWFESKNFGGNPGQYPDEVKIIAHSQTVSVEPSKNQAKISSQASEPTVQSQPKTTPSSETKPSLVATVASASTSVVSARPALPTPDFSALIINEFLPNPEGRDETEFVELYNSGDEPIDLRGVILEIGRKKISLNGTIGAGQFFVMRQADYHFAIKNSGERLALIDSAGNLIFEITYRSKATVGKSFSRTATAKWQWTEPTPGQTNSFRATVTTGGRREAETVTPAMTDQFQQLAQVQQNVLAEPGKASLPLSPLLIGLGLAVVGAVAVLFLHR